MAMTPTINDQIERMEMLWPALRVRCRLPWYCSWEGEIKPEQQTYRIEIVHRIDFDMGGCLVHGLTSPNVRVLNPELSITLENYRDVHVFLDTKCPTRSRLCLHYPPDASWTDEDLIADKLLPWICHWLSLYECYEATGTWYHEGLHPDDEEHERLVAEWEADEAKALIEKPAFFRMSVFDSISRKIGHSASSVSMEAGSKEYIPLHFWRDWNLSSRRLRLWRHTLT